MNSDFLSLMPRPRSRSLEARPAAKSKENASKEGEKQHEDSGSSILNRELKESIELFKSKDQEYEQVGLEILRYRDEISKLQHQMTTKAEEYENVATKGNGLKAKCAKDQDRLANKQQQLNSVEKEVMALKEELNRVNDELAQVSGAKEPGPDDVKIVKFAAQKATKDLEQAEDQKRKQDDLIKKLGRSIRNLENELESFDEKIQLGRDEQVTTKQELGKVQNRLKTAAEEKQNLFQHWNTVLKELKKKDGKLDHFKTELSKYAKCTRSLSVPSSADSRLTFNRVSNTKLEEKIQKLEKELDDTRNNLRQQQKHQAKVDCDAMGKRKELREMQNQLNLLDVEKRKADNQLRIVQAKIDAERSEAAKLEENLMQSSKNDPTVTAAKKQLKKIRDQNLDAEIECEEFTRQLADADLKHSELLQRISNKNRSLDNYSKIADEKVKMVSMLEAEVKRAKQTNVSKQLQLDRLVSRSGVGHKGPITPVSSP